MGYAEEYGISLIVMTTHGRGGVVRTALGSVTDRLLGGSTPVWVVHTSE
jgi:nucleotide-binding universal stress UspA family protein